MFIAIQLSPFMYFNTSSNSTSTATELLKSRAQSAAALPPPRHATAPVCVVFTTRTGDRLQYYTDEAWKPEPGPPSPVVEKREGVLARAPSPPTSLSKPRHKTGLPDAVLRRCVVVPASRAIVSVSYDDGDNITTCESTLSRDRAQSPPGGV